MKSPCQERWSFCRRLKRELHAGSHESFERQQADKSWSDIQVLVGTALLYVRSHILDMFSNQVGGI